MALLYSRYIILGRSLSLGRKSMGNLCPQTRNKISLLQHCAHRRFTALSVCVNVKNRLVENVCRFGHWSAPRTAMVTHMYCQHVGKLDLESENGGKQFSTSTLLHSSNQPPIGSLIYKGDLNAIVKVLKIFSLTSSVIACCVLPLVVIYNTNSVLSVILGSFAGLNVFTPFILQWFTKGYVTHIYFNRDTDTYTALTYTLLLRPKQLRFSPDDVKVPAVRSLLTSFLAKDVPLLVDDTKFANPNDVLHLKGYDKVQGDMSLDDLKKIYQAEEAEDKRQ